MDWRVSSVIAAGALLTTLICFSRGYPWYPHEDQINSNEGSNTFDNENTLPKDIDLSKLEKNSISKPYDNITPIYLSSLMKISRSVFTEQDIRAGFEGNVFAVLNGYVYMFPSSPKLFFWESIKKQCVEFTKTIALGTLCTKLQSAVIKRDLTEVETKLVSNCKIEFDSFGEIIGVLQWHDGHIGPRHIFSSDGKRLILRSASCEVHPFTWRQIVRPRRSENSASISSTCLCYSLESLPPTATLRSQHRRETFAASSTAPMHPECLTTKASHINEQNQLSHLEAVGQVKCCLLILSNCECDDMKRKSNSSEIEMKYLRLHPYIKAFQEERTTIKKKVIAILVASQQNKEVELSNSNSQSLCNFLINEYTALNSVLNGSRIVALYDNINGNDEQPILLSYFFSQKQENSSIKQTENGHINNDEVMEKEAIGLAIDDKSGLLVINDKKKKKKNKKKRQERRQQERLQQMNGLSHNFEQNEQEFVEIAGEDEEADEDDCKKYSDDETAKPNGVNSVYSENMNDKPKTLLNVKNNDVIFDDLKPLEETKFKITDSNSEIKINRDTDQESIVSKNKDGNANIRHNSEDAFKGMIHKDEAPTLIHQQDQVDTDYDKVASIKNSMTIPENLAQGEEKTSEDNENINQNPFSRELSNKHLVHSQLGLYEEIQQLLLSDPQCDDRAKSNFVQELDELADENQEHHIHHLNKLLCDSPQSSSQRKNDFNNNADNTHINNASLATSEEKSFGYHDIYGEVSLSSDIQLHHHSSPQILSGDQHFRRQSFHSSFMYPSFEYKDEMQHSNPNQINHAHSVPLQQHQVAFSTLENDIQSNHHHNHDLFCDNTNFIPHSQSMPSVGNHHHHMQSYNSEINNNLPKSNHIHCSKNNLNVNNHEYLSSNDNLYTLQTSFSSPSRVSIGDHYFLPSPSVSNPALLHHQLPGYIVKLNDPQHNHHHQQQQQHNEDDNTFININNGSINPTVPIHDEHNSATINQFSYSSSENTHLRQLLHTNGFIAQSYHNNDLSNNEQHQISFQREITSSHDCLQIQPSFHSPHYQTDVSNEFVGQVVENSNKSNSNSCVSPPFFPGVLPSLSIDSCSSPSMTGSLPIMQGSSGQHQILHHRIQNYNFEHSALINNSNINHLQGHSNSSAHNSYLYFNNENTNIPSNLNSTSQASIHHHNYHPDHLSIQQHQHQYALEQYEDLHEFGYNNTILIPSQTTFSHSDLVNRGDTFHD